MRSTSSGATGTAPIEQLTSTTATEHEAEADEHDARPPMAPFGLRSREHL